MPDIADDNANFREAMARAEAAAGIVRDESGTELNGVEAFVRGETPALAELEGAVPVQASDQPLTPGEPAVEAATSQEQQQEAPVAQPTVAELQAQLAAAEARLAEKDSFIGRQSSEIGELRTRVDEIAAQQAQPVTPVIPITQELIDADPASATQAAFAQKNEAALERAWNAWDAEGDGAARLWLTERRAEQREAQLRAEIDATRNELAQLREPIQQQTAEAAQNQAWKEAFDAVRAKHPDVFEKDENGATIAERLIHAAGTKPEYETFKELLQNGDANAKATALSALYAMERLGDPAGLQQQLAEAAQQAEAEAAAARAAAGVVNGQTTAGQQTELKTTEELEQDAYIQRQKGKPSLARGWTGRS